METFGPFSCGGELEQRPTTRASTALGLPLPLIQSRRQGQSSALRSRASRYAASNSGELTARLLFVKPLLPCLANSTAI